MSYQYKNRKPVEPLPEILAALIVNIIALAVFLAVPLVILAACVKIILA